VSENKYNFFYYSIRIYEKKALIFVSTNKKTTITMKTIDARLTALKIQLGRVAGIPVEVYFRGDTSFTIGFEGSDKEAANKIVTFFSTSGAKSVEAEYDIETQYTAIYLEA
jgi:NMD protein affecting ribosome stability and mRNA decay